MIETRTNDNYRDRVYASYGKNFQDAGDKFDQDGAVRWGKARRYHLRGWMPKDKAARMLDLACGDGKLLHFFLRSGYRNIEGIDISSDQVSLARQVTPNIVQGDVIEYLEAHSGQFDLITGFDIVEHFHKNEALHFLDAAYAALKPGGRLILQTPNAGTPWGSQPRYGDFTHELGFSPNALERLFRMVGFVHSETRECDPPPFGLSLFSSIRYSLWQLLRLRLMMWNLIETGSAGEPVFTRVFLISGVREP